jgi:hypothetical protein
MRLGDLIALLTAPQARPALFPLIHVPSARYMLERQHIRSAREIASRKDLAFRKKGEQEITIGG